MAFKVHESPYQHDFNYDFCPGTCNHDRCQELRILVLSKCPGCNEELGTENWLVKDHEGRGWHRDCKMDDDDRKSNV